MLWGETYWGDGTWGAAMPLVRTFAQSSAIDLPDISRTDRAKALAQVYARRWQALDQAIADALPSLVVNYSTAQGAWLQAAGRYLGLAQDARSREYFRLLCATYAKLWSTRRTITALLEALSALCDGRRVEYALVSAKRFRVLVTVDTTVAQSEFDLRRVVEYCTPATYQAEISVAPIGALLATDVAGVAVITDAGVVGDVAGVAPTSGVGRLAWL